MDEQAAKDHLAQIVSHAKNTYAPQSISTYQYWAFVKHIVDGDTLDLKVAAGFNLTVEERFRLIGVNTPEIHGVKKSSEEYGEGIKAKQFVEEFIPDHGWIEVEIYVGQREKYGRWLCQIYDCGKSLNVELLANNHAVPIY